MTGREELALPARDPHARPWGLLLRGQKVPLPRRHPPSTGLPHNVETSLPAQAGVGLRLLTGRPANPGCPCGKEQQRHWGDADRHCAARPRSRQDGTYLDSVGHSHCSLSPKRQKHTNHKRRENHVYNYNPSLILSLPQRQTEHHQKQAWNRVLLSTVLLACASGSLRGEVKLLLGACLPNRRTPVTLDHGTSAPTSPCCALAARGDTLASGGVDAQTNWMRCQQAALQGFALTGRNPAEPTDWKPRCIWGSLHWNQSVAPSLWGSTLHWLQSALGVQAEHVPTHALSLRPAPTHRRQAPEVRGARGGLAAPLRPSLGCPGRRSPGPLLGLLVGEESLQWLWVGPPRTWEGFPVPTGYEEVPREPPPQPESPQT